MFGITIRPRRPREPRSGGGGRGGPPDRLFTLPAGVWPGGEIPGTGNKQVAHLSCRGRSEGDLLGCRCIGCDT
jgi:hypothetical protein